MQTRVLQQIHLLISSESVNDQAPVTACESFLLIGIHSHGWSYSSPGLVSDSGLVLMALLLAGNSLLLLPLGPSIGSPCPNLAILLAFSLHSHGLSYSAACRRSCCGVCFCAPDGYRGAMSSALSDDIGDDELWWSLE